MSIATKASILAARSTSLTPVAIEVAELGGTVHVARMNARQADQYGRETKNACEGENRGTILVSALVNANGERLFDVQDAAALSELPNNVVEEVIELFADINGLNAKKASPRKSCSTSASPASPASSTSTA